MLSMETCQKFFHFLPIDSDYSGCPISTHILHKLHSPSNGVRQSKSDSDHLKSYAQNFARIPCRSCHGCRKQARAKREDVRRRNF